MKMNKYNIYAVFIIVLLVTVVSGGVLYFLKDNFSLGLIVLVILSSVALGIIIYDRVNTARLKTSFGRFINQIKQGNYESSKSKIIKKYDFVNITDIQVELSQIVGQIQADYKEQKKYIENVNHELMTPIAIIRGKLELLIQSPNIKKGDFTLINGILLKLDRLAKVNQSLVLLSKIDHNQYPSKELVNFNEVIDETLNLFEDQIRIDELTVRKTIKKQLKFDMNETLAFILIKNIIKNAVIHNIEKGFISITTDQNQIIIKNSGQEITTPTEKLFERFQVEKESEDSIGLGLSIIQRICEVSNINLAYHHHAGNHEITLIFND